MTSKSLSPMMQMFASIPNSPGLEWYVYDDESGAVLAVCATKEMADSIYREHGFAYERAEVGTYRVGDVPQYDDE